MPMIVLVVWMMAAGVIVVVMRMLVVVVGVPTIVIVSVVMTMSGVVRLLAGLGLHIGAALGIERRLERDHPSPEPLGHRLDDGIAADPQRLRQHFGQ